MSSRQLASPKQRRGEITTDEAVRQVFSRLVKDKPTPADTQTNRWKMKKFRTVIRGDKHNSELPHDIEVEIKNLSQYADFLNIAKNTLAALLYKEFPNGVPSRSKTLADAKVAEYQKTLCHQYLEKHYKNPVTGDWGSGHMVDAMGQNLYMMFGQRDPALFTLEMFQQARNDPRFYDEKGKIKFAPLSQIRCIIKFAALQIEDSPLSQRRFQFLEGDMWDTTGKKNIGGKIDDYLQEEELKRYVENIGEIDTLVLQRLGLEGFGRISSQLLMGKTVTGSYRCQALWDLNSISMFEPKVEGSKSGGKVKRIFVPETMAFFKRYVKDCNIVGAWFKRFPSEEHNCLSYSSSIKLAGLRAGIWHFKFIERGEQLAEGEKATSTGQVYRLKSVINNQKGTQEFHKQWLFEGKMTTSHTTMKHTGVSLAGLHGWSLENCSQQSGTDATTLKDFYHGTLGADLQKVVMGERTFEPWINWIHRFVNPLFTKRYDELMSEGKATIDLSRASQEEAVMAAVEEK